VQQRSNGRSIEIDTGMLTEMYSGSGNALVIEGGRVTVVNQDGRTGMSPVDHPIRVGHELLPIGEHELETVLASGDLVELTAEGETRRLMEVTYSDLAVFARFSESQDNDPMPEVAAYRLDRMLGLGMVPVTVRREVDGQLGTLQLVPATAVTGDKFVGIEGRVAAPCSLDKQAATMRVFDALIDNTARTSSAMLYDPQNMLLILVDHGAAFGAGTVWQGHAAAAEFVVGDEWRRALRELDDDALQAELGDVLDERQLAGLKQRRDALLDSPAVHRSD